MTNKHELVTFGNPKFVRDLKPFSSPFFGNEIFSILDPPSGRSSKLAHIPLDFLEEETGYRVQVDLPGINCPEDIEVTFNKGKLIIEGERKSSYSSNKEEGDDGDDARQPPKFKIQGRILGSFRKELTLPEAIDTEGFEARYQHGVLDIFIPKAEEVKPKKIEIIPIE